MATYSPRKSIIFEFQRCQWHCWNHFSGINDTAEMAMTSRPWQAGRSMTPLKSQWWQSEKFHRDINYRNFFCRISAVSITPLKWLRQAGLRFQQCNWHRWNNFRGVNGTAETISAVSMTPLKLMWHHWNLKQTLQVLFLPLQGKSSKNISMATIPILFKLPRPHFRFQRWFWRLSKRLSRRIRRHMQNGFSMLIRYIQYIGLIDEKNRESKFSWHCPFNILH
jgi:hypothetical protein